MIEKTRKSTQSARLKPNKCFSMIRFCWLWMHGTDKQKYVSTPSDEPMVAASFTSPSRSATGTDASG